MRTDADDLDLAIVGDLAHDRDNLRGTDVETHEQILVATPGHRSGPRAASIAASPPPPSGGALPAFQAMLKPLL